MTGPLPSVPGGRDGGGDVRPDGPGAAPPLPVGPGPSPAPPASLRRPQPLPDVPAAARLALLPAPVPGRDAEPSQAGGDLGLRPRPPRGPRLGARPAGTGPTHSPRAEFDLHSAPQPSARFSRRPLALRPLVSLHPCCPGERTSAPRSPPTSPRTSPWSHGQTPRPPASPRGPGTGHPMVHLGETGVGLLPSGGPFSCLTDGSAHLSAAPGPQVLPTTLPLQLLGRRVLPSRPPASSNGQGLPSKPTSRTPWDRLYDPRDPVRRVSVSPLFRDPPAGSHPLNPGAAEALPLRSPPRGSPASAFRPGLPPRGPEAPARVSLRQRAPILRQRRPLHSTGRAGGRPRTARPPGRSRAPTVPLPARPPPPTRLFSSRESERRRGPGPPRPPPRSERRRREHRPGLYPRAPDSGSRPRVPSPGARRRGVTDSAARDAVLLASGARRAARGSPTSSSLWCKTTGTRTCSWSTGSRCTRSTPAAPLPWARSPPRDGWGGRDGAPTLADPRASSVLSGGKSTPLPLPDTLLPVLPAHHEG